jgi:hypothetical protein
VAITGTFLKFLIPYRPCLAMAKAAFNKKNLFTSKLDLNMCGAETSGSTWKVLKCGAGEGWRRSVGAIM